ncbi:MAG: OpgC protein [Pseudomonadota bacterium]
MQLENTLSQPGWLSRTQEWIYPDTGHTRDPRLDFMRGLVFILLFAVHFDYFSIFTFVAWERIGVVSSAETFIALAGIVTGLVFGRKLKETGVGSCLPGLVSRAGDLYKTSVIVILLIGLMRYQPWIDMTAVTTFHDPYTDTNYPLYAHLDAGFWKMVGDALLLKSGPHQFQVIGLYCYLFLLTPVILFMISKEKTIILSAISCLIYIGNFLVPETTPGTAQIRITGSEFEFGFPLVAWQVLFVHSVIAGYYKREIVDYLAQPKNQWLIWLCVVMSLGFMFFSLNHPIDLFPAWAQLNYIDDEVFKKIFNGYFQKYKLGPGRLLNEVVLFVTVFAVLTRFWQPINRALGWFFIPLGESSLYVFTVHVFLLVVVSNTPLPSLHNFWVNSAIHVWALLVAWLAVKKQFLFKWMPH